MYIDSTIYGKVDTSYNKLVKVQIKSVYNPIKFTITLIKNKQIYINSIYIPFRDVIQQQGRTQELKFQ